MASDELVIDLDAAEEPLSDDDDSIAEGQRILTSYESNDVPIPAGFLTTQPADAKPVTIKPIDWESSPLPHNSGRYAVVLDNVLSPSECDKLLQLAEASVPPSAKELRGRGSGAAGTTSARPWRPALVNVGHGYEALYKDYRNSDRIIWDEQAVVDRLWARCLQAPGVAETLGGVIENNPKILGYHGEEQRWKFRRLNQRMRFLRYGPGQFFRPHCDGAYREQDDEKVLKTIFTIHLYLNDSKAEVGEAAELEGGATSFLSNDETKKMDVDPRAGRVLIFQHLGLYHSGDEVLKGIKYTMRTDILYELID